MKKFIEVKKKWYSFVIAFAIIVGYMTIGTETVRAASTEQINLSGLKNIANIITEKGKELFTYSVCHDKTHLYENTPTFCFANDGKSCTAIYKCKNCSHTNSVKCRVTSEVKAMSTYTEKGVTTYKATAIHPITGKKSSDTKDVADIAIRVPAVNGSINFNYDNQNTIVTRMCEENRKYQRNIFFW